MASRYSYNRRAADQEEDEWEAKERSELLDMAYNDERVDLRHMAKWTHKTLIELVDLKDQFAKTVDNMLELVGEYTGGNSERAALLTHLKAELHKIDAHKSDVTAFIAMLEKASNIL